MAPALGKPLRNRAIRSILLGTTAAAVTIVPVDRWSAPLRLMYHWGPALLAGTGFALALSSDDFDRRLSPTQATAVGVAVTGAVYAASFGEAKAESAIESRLSQLGVSRPRWWMAAGNAGLAVALELLHDRIEQKE